LKIDFIGLGLLGCKIVDKNVAINYVHKAFSTGRLVKVAWKRVFIFGAFTIYIIQQ